jgi:hypothetical protein
MRSSSVRSWRRIRQTLRRSARWTATVLAMQLLTGGTLAGKAAVIQKRVDAVPAPPGPDRDARGPNLGIWLAGARHSAFRSGLISNGGCASAGPREIPTMSKSSTTTKRRLAPVHPGKILLEEFLLPLGLTQYRLAKGLTVPPRRINEIVHGSRAITADTDSDWPASLAPRSASGSIFRRPTTWSWSGTDWRAGSSARCRCSPRQLDKLHWRRSLTSACS